MTEKGNHIERSLFLARCLLIFCNICHVLALLPEFCKSFQITFCCLLVTQVWVQNKNPPPMLGPLAGEVLKAFSYKSSFPPGRDRETLPDISLLHAQPYRWALHRMPLIHNHKVILILPSEHSIIIWLLG